jgi:ATP/maltotriose-dependent transcriptional regulator MalT
MASESQGAMRGDGNRAKEMMMREREIVEAMSSEDFEAWVDVQDAKMSPAEKRQRKREQEMMDNMTDAEVHTTVIPL